MFIKPMMGDQRVDSQEDKVGIELRDYARRGAPLRSGVWCLVEL